MRIVNRTARKQTINGISLNPNEEYINRPTVIEPPANVVSDPEPQVQTAVVLSTETATGADVQKLLEQEHLEALRSEYISLTGKRFYHGWDAEELQNRIDAARGE